MLPGQRAIPAIVSGVTAEPMAEPSSQNVTSRQRVGKAASRPARAAALVASTAPMSHGAGSPAAYASRPPAAATARASAASSASRIRGARRGA